MDSMNLHTQNRQKKVEGKITFKALMNKVTEARELSLLLLIIVIFAISAITLPYFATFSNIAAVLLGLSFDGIIAVGMMMCMVCGFFDLSVGSNVALSGAVAAYLIKYLNVNVGLSIIVALAVAVLAGFINGIFTAKIKVNPFITTLATMGILRGAAILISGTGIPFLPESFTQFGQKLILGLQAPVWIMIVIALIGGILLKHSRYFRQFYFVGGNEKAAVLSGINTTKIKIVCFMITGFLAGVAGILQAARLGTAMSTAGTNQELNIITAVIIGGASLTGGKGTIAGAILGTIFMALVKNIMVLAGVSVYWQNIVIGIVLLAAVSLDVILNRKSR